MRGIAYLLAYALSQLVNSQQKVDAIDHQIETVVAHMKGPGIISATTAAVSALQRTVNYYYYYVCTLNENVQYSFPMRLQMGRH